MGEPLWRVKTKPFVGSDRSYIGFTELDVPGFTEVEVWPAGDRTPTREHLWQVVYENLRGFNTVPAQKLTDALWELLHGEGDATDD